MKDYTNANVFLKQFFFLLYNLKLYRASWDNLLKQLSQREQRLFAAGEIHRFHRDVAEALFRIQVNNFKNI